MNMADQPADNELNELEAVKEQLLRCQADYQNLLRRSRDERAQLAKMAARDAVEAILQPLEHLELAAKQISDSGLNMVVEQFKQNLGSLGLEEINPQGEKFDVNRMEAVEGSDPNGDLVSEVQAKGYSLNGQVIRHAKVVVK
jgi:molecular chaperone GrpE